MINIKIDFNIFISKYENIISIGDKLIQLKEISVNELNNQIDLWENKLINYLTKNIPSIPEKLTNKIKYTENVSFLTRHLQAKEFDLNEPYHIDYLKEDIQKKITQANIVKDYLSITDSLTKSPQPELQLNKIQDKFLYVLLKLNQLYNDNYYSVSIIFELNGIEYRNDEPKEIADDLKKRGYVSRKSDYSDNEYIKITVKGAAYVERQIKIGSSTKKKKNSDDLNIRIDAILDKLKELGYGQEIIFDEINELRDLSKKLSKKSLSQLIKGKVIDLAIMNLINRDTASFIYETLVEDKFKLLR